MTVYSDATVVPNYTNNPKFYNRLQAKVFAETYYKMGIEVYEETLPLLSDGNIEDRWKLWPAFVNIAFSCEIILKLFYESDYAEMAQGHKLYTDLYSKLSEDSKRRISSTTINYMLADGFDGYSEKEFYDDIEESENTFAHERYSFEMVPGRESGLRCGFLLWFSKALNDLARNLK